MSVYSLAVDLATEPDVVQSMIAAYYKVIDLKELQFPYQRLMLNPPPDVPFKLDCFGLQVEEDVLYSQKEWPHSLNISQPLGSWTCLTIMKGVVNCARVGSCYSGRQTDSDTLTVAGTICQLSIDLYIYMSDLPAPIQRIDRTTTLHSLSLDRHDSLGLYESLHPFSLH